MAITYGMSVKEFWEDNPDLFWAYRFSYYTSKKTEQEMFNNNAWLQGAYFHEAVAVALCNAFSKNKIEYSKKPYDFNVKKEDTKKIQQENFINQLKKRVGEVQAIKGKNSSTTERVGTEGGEKING